jgi:hypothetical protein
MASFEPKSLEVNVFPEPQDDERPLALEVDWTKEEEARAKRK